MSSSGPNRSRLDALVIGGGPAGTTAALFLARRGWQVGLVEKSTFPRRKVCGEFLSVTNLPLLAEAGVAEDFMALAGPVVRRVAIFHGRTVITAPLPCATGKAQGAGRALGRECLDALLLDRAVAAGTRVWQPWTATSLQRTDQGYCCELTCDHGRTVERVQARVVVAAHGSWHSGHLPTQTSSNRASSRDLLAFKAHFHQAHLDPDLMPLLAFPGGYGGLVRTDRERTSLSVCITRSQLERCRAAHPRASAAESVLFHLRNSCAPVAEVLERAERDGEWLAAGAIRPGIRIRGAEGIFLVGNAAGEAHPVVAEGIGMAMQSAWLLASSLPFDPGELANRLTLRAAHRAYAHLWRKNFAGRIRVSAAIAHWAMHPAAVYCLSPLLRCCPALLTLGAQASGKARLPSAGSGRGSAGRGLSWPQTSSTGNPSSRVDAA